MTCGRGRLPLSRQLPGLQVLIEALRRSDRQRGTALHLDRLGKLY